MVLADFASSSSSASVSVPEMMKTAQELLYLDV